MLFSSLPAMAEEGADFALPQGTETFAVSENEPAVAEETTVPAEEEPTPDAVKEKAPGTVTVNAVDTAALQGSSATFGLVVKKPRATEVPALAEQLSAEGARITVLSGLVPLGTDVTYTLLDAEAAQALALRYLAGREALIQPSEEISLNPLKASLSPIKSGAAVQGGANISSPAAVSDGAEDAKTEQSETPEAPDAEEDPRSGSATGYAAFEMSLSQAGQALDGEGQYLVTVDLGLDVEELVPRFASVTDVSYNLYHIYQEEAEQLSDFSVDDGALTFQTQGLDSFILEYTVSFTYNGVSFTLLGNQETALSTLLTALETGVDISEVTAVSYAGEALAVEESEGDWLIRALPVEKESGTLTVETADGPLYIDLSATGIEQLEVGNAVIRAADGVYLPEDASGYSRESEDSAAAVDAVTAYDETAAETDEGTVAAYQVFDIGLENVNEADYAAGFQVEITLEEAVDPAQARLYHLHEGEVSEITDVEWTEVGFSFVTDGFSEFVLRYALELYYQDREGDTWKITAAYTDQAGIPEGAQLEVAEVTGEAYEEYVGRTAAFMGAEGFAYARVFDISIVDAEGAKVQPQAGVEIKVELMDAEESENDYSVVHFAPAEDEETGDRAEWISAATDGDTVTFTAEGFSYYAIVNGPNASTIDFGWKLATNGENNRINLRENTPYYISNRGYYLKNGDIVGLSGNTNRYGILETEVTFEEVPVDEAAKYYIKETKIDDTIYTYKFYTIKNDIEFYIKMENIHYTGRAGLQLVEGEENATPFSVKWVKTSNAFKVYAKVDGDTFYWNRNTKPGTGNGALAGYFKEDDDNVALIQFHYFIELGEEPYGLNENEQFALISWTGGLSGKALMAEASEAGKLKAEPLNVMVSQENNTDHLFASKTTDATLWVFEWVTNDLYYIKTHNPVSETEYLYLKIDENGVSVTSDKDDSNLIQVMLGKNVGAEANQIWLRSAANTNKLLSYQGATQGFGLGGDPGSECLYLAELADLGPEYALVHTADKVGVSQVVNKQEIVIYTRFWNDAAKQYEFYAVDHDGTLVRVFESGDSIQWWGGQLNTMLWDFIEYYWEDSGEPNYYYDLYNEYAGKYLAPQIKTNQILSDNTIGLNLNGRRDGKYYSTILAWDAGSYAFAGLKVMEEDGQKYVVPCSRIDADDFYFAIVQEIPVDDVLNTVPTVNNNDYGIIMKMIDLENNNNKVDGYMNTFFGGNGNTKELLSTKLGSDGYPTRNIPGGQSLKTLYNGAEEVNHLFIASTYQSSGYYEFDSTQNFASLQNGNFKVYRQLGTSDKESKTTLKHGQFLPYNDIQAGVYAEDKNPQNLYSALSIPGNNTKGLLDDSNPRKYEQLYDVGEPNYFFAMEIEASFTQTPSGHDAWGHDIIYEFTGDDDFWLYVDGELIIDLGGVHSAEAGSVNYCTGEVYVNGTWTTIRDLFIANRGARGESTDVSDIFELKVDSNGVPLKDTHGHNIYTFKDYTSHTMRIFYMERGAGASNLHMRFNLDSVQPGHVLLKKELEGVDEAESQFAEYAYQVFYNKNEELEGEITDEGWELLTKDAKDFSVNYVDTETPVTYKDSITIGGTEYEHVFILKPGQTADIYVPYNAIRYKIVECGIKDDLYTSVAVKELTGEGLSKETKISTYSDYITPEAQVKERPRVTYVNTIDSSKLGSLSFTKQLFKPTEETDGVLIPHSEDPKEFEFRLYLATGLEEDPPLVETNMQSYHVKDEGGYYCVWNEETGRFQRYDGNIKDYSNYLDLPAADRNRLTFHTSIYGSIGNIPNGYTVEVNGLMPDTRYKVVEEESKIPDGYSFSQYEYNSTTTFIADNGASGIIEAGDTSEITVKNLKGFGVRLKKIWTDEDFVAERDSAYFAIYAKVGDTLQLVPGSVKQLKFGEETLYWYYERLPVSSVTDLNNYLVYEVTLGADAVLDAQGDFVSGSISILDENNDQVKLQGKLYQQTASSSMTYSVSYDRGTVGTGENSNIRVDTVTNSRPGVDLYKTDWNGNPLPGAVVQVSLPVEGSNDVRFGPYTSDEDGKIATLYLLPETNYTLTEISAPKGYYGLVKPLTIRQDSAGNVTVSGESEDTGCFTWTMATTEPETPARIEVKNRTMTFQVVKLGGDSLEDENAVAIRSVTFSLHQQKTVGSVTQIDSTPMAGYEHLESDENGIVEKVNEQLTANTYELRELTVPGGYQSLSLPQVKFTISPLGEVSLDRLRIIPGVELTQDTSQEGTVAYTLEILNHPAANLTVKKVVTGTGDQNEVFTFRLVSVQHETYGTQYAWKKYDSSNSLTASTENGGTALTTKNGENTFTLKHGESIVLEVPKNKNVVIEEVIAESTGYTTSWSVTNGQSGSTIRAEVTLQDDGTLTFTNHKGEVYVAPTGVESGAAPYLAVLAVGAALMILAVGKRRSKR